MWFRRRGGKKASGPSLTRTQAFEARPMAIATIKREPLDQGGQRLMIPYRPSGYQKWLLRIPDTATRKIELDAVGVEVFDMCDGKTAVRQITRRFAKQHQVDLHEAEMAVVTFIRTMMRKGLVSMVVDKG